MSFSEELNKVIPLLKQLNLAVIQYKDTKATEYDQRLFAITWAKRNIGFCEEVSAKLAKLIMLSEKKEEDAGYKKKLSVNVGVLTEDIHLFSAVPDIDEKTKNTCQEILEKLTAIAKVLPAPGAEIKNG